MASKRELIRHTRSTTAVMLPFEEVFLETPAALSVVLSRMNRASWLGACGQLLGAMQADVVDEATRTEFLCRFFRREEVERIRANRGSERLTFLLDPFSTAVAAQVAAAHAPEFGNAPDMQSACRMAVMLAYQCFGMLGPDSAVPEDAMLGTLQSITARSERTPPRFLLQRASAVWISDHAFLDEKCKKARTSMSAALEKHASLGIGQWVAGLAWLSWGYSAGLFQNSLCCPSDLSLPLPSLSDVGNATVKAACAACATRISDFSKRCQSLFPIDAASIRPTVEPVETQPLLQEHIDASKFLILSPRHLAELAVRPQDAIWSRLTQAERSTLGGYFGDAIEGYVCALLAACLSGRFRRIQEQARAEGFAQLGRILVVVECKSSLDNRRERHEAVSDDELANRLSRKGHLDKAKSQLTNTIAELLTNPPSSVHVDAIELVIPMIVSYDVMAMSPLLGEEIETLLGGETAVEGKRVSVPQVVTITELEKLAGWDWKPSDALAAKVNDPHWRFGMITHFLDGWRPGPRAAPKLLLKAEQAVVELWQPLWAEWARTGRKKR